MPKGPKGDQGLSAYEVWKQEVEKGSISWPRNETAVADFFKYLKGQDGKDGADGISAYDQWKDLVAQGNVDNPHRPGEKWPTGDNTVQHFWHFLTGATGEKGQTPHIGTDGNWWIGTHNTNIPARGQDGRDGRDGQDGKTPHIGSNGNWWIGTNDTGVQAKGQDGQTPHIGTNGNWWIGTTDTNIPARGQDGRDGRDGQDGKTPHIGSNGNWIINGVDTGKRAFGRDGQQGQPGQPGRDGASGKSAYDLWKEEVTSKCGTPNAIMHPHKPTEAWPCSQVSLQDFWNYLRGQDGKDGRDGTDGKDGENAPITIQAGKFNVVPQYWNADHKEYVSPKDGGVTYKVFDKSGAPAPAGSTVKGLPGIKDPNKVYTTEADGTFRVPREDLPDQKAVEMRRGVSQEVTIHGQKEASAPNTLVPNRVNVRVSVESAGYSVNYSTQMWPLIEVKMKVERQVNGEWGAFPDGVPASDVAVLKVKDHTKALNPSNLSGTPQDKRWLLKSTSDIATGIITARIYRPLVLTAREEVYISRSENHDKRQYMYKWNNQENYLACEFGDDNGAANDYGYKFVVPEIFLIPEVNPQPPLKSVSYEIKHGLTTLFGEVDIDKLSYFYKGYAKSGSSNVWKPLEKVNSNKLPGDYKLVIDMEMNVGSTTGRTKTTTKAPVPPNRRFELNSAYPNNALQIGATDDTMYRRLLYYTFKLDSSGNYYMDDYYTPGNKQMDVPLGTKPVDWMN